MTVDTESQTNEGEVQAAFEQYAERLRRGDLQLPRELEAGAPVPPSWSGTSEEWEMVRRRAVDAFHQKPTYEFAHGIAVRGYRPSELATGRLAPGAAIGVMDGRVRRPPPSTLDAETEEQARQVLRGLGQRNLTLFASLQLALELGSIGRWTSQARTVHAAIREGSAAIEKFDRERQEAAAEEDAKPLLVVLFDFRAMGQQYHQGERRHIGPEEDENLVLWWDRKFADAKQRGQDPPECPFEIQRDN